MGKSKQKQQTTNTYAYQTPPETADITALRNMKAKADPSIPYTYARIREQQENSYKSPLGAYTSPAVRDAVNRGASKRLALDEAQALETSQFNADNTNYARQAGIAGMTAPQLVQTGGTTTMTKPKDWTSLLFGAGQAAGNGAKFASAAGV